MREGSPAPALAILRAAKPLRRLLEQRGANVWVLEKLDGPLAHLRIRQELQGEGFLVRARVLEKLDGPLAHLSIGQ